MSAQDHTDSFTEFVEHRHDTNRSVAVYVEGDLTNDPPLGNAEAKRVAELLTDDDDRVLRIDPESASDDVVPEDVGTVLATLPPNADEREWQPVQRRLLSRVPSDVDIVVLVDADEVPWFCKELADVRVVASEIDAPVKYDRVRLDPYSGDVHYHRFEEVPAADARE